MNIRCLWALGLAAVLAGTSQASIMPLTGQAPASGLPLDVLVAFDVQSSTSLTITLTNEASEAGPNARITYFGLQLPNDDITLSIAPGTVGSWSITKDGKLPDGGAATFRWLIKAQGGGAGLRLDEQLVLNVVSAEPAFEPLTLADWTPTSKMGYVAAAKFQGVGLIGESGLALTQSPTLYDVPPVLVPEPASLAMIGLGAGLMLWRRRAAA